MAKKQIQPVDSIEELFEKVEEIIIDAIKEEPKEESPKILKHPLEAKVLALVGKYDANRIAAMLMIDSDIVKSIIRDAGK